MNFECLFLRSLLPYTHLRSNNYGRRTDVKTFHNTTEKVQQWPFWSERWPQTTIRTQQSTSDEYRRQLSAGGILPFSCSFSQKQGDQQQTILLLMMMACFCWILSEQRADDGRTVGLKYLFVSTKYTYLTTYVHNYYRTDEGRTNVSKSIFICRALLF